MSSKTVQPIRRREQGETRSRRSARQKRDEQQNGTADSQKRAGGNEKQTFCQTETGEKRDCAKQCADHIF